MIHSMMLYNALWSLRRNAYSVFAVGTDCTTESKLQWTKRSTGPTKPESQRFLLRPLQQLGKSSPVVPFQYRERERFGVWFFTSVSCLPAFPIRRVSVAISNRNIITITASQADTASARETTKRLSLIELVASCHHMQDRRARLGLQTRQRPAVSCIR